MHFAYKFKIYSMKFPYLQYPRNKKKLDNSKKMWYTVQHKLNPTQIILGIMAMNEQMNNGRGVSEKHHYAESCPNSNAL